MNLYPTARCFDDASEYINDLCIKGNAKGFYLCHGLCHSPKGLYSHAWVYDENTNIIISKFKFRKKKKDKLIYVNFNKSDFYKQLKVHSCSYYTVKQLFYLNWKYNTFGPWEKMYLEKCSDGGKVLKKAKRYKSRMFAKILNDLD